jgi:hypothetical protein|tara:strand:- start:1118 stop:1987 length:870 start_codon:yes stop_codon:yes gene_type:complete
MITAIAAGIGAVVNIVGGIIQRGQAQDAKADAEREKSRLNREIQIFESNRQDVINPYSGVTSLAGLATDLSGNLSNPFANLGVATGAAEIQMEQTDIALANTLDVLQATGASAGGATALAQAAKRSKKEVSASIQMQEAKNEQLAAQGEARMQQQYMAEQARLQRIQISEGGRAQNAQAQGAAFQYNAQESRDLTTLDRMQAGVDQANVNMANANAAEQGAIGSMIGGVTSMGSALLQSGAFNSNLTPNEFQTPGINFDDPPPIIPTAPYDFGGNNNPVGPFSSAFETN